MKYAWNVSLLCWTFFAPICLQAQQRERSVSVPHDEVIYHVFQRSFFDSNNDLHGDLNGLAQKLDYLQDLGVTSILLLPLYKSPFYHNYFADDFEVIDEEFGTKADYLSLVKKIHARGMKVYMDMETQYITSDHRWYKEAVGNPASAYSDYLVFNGPGNTQPESMVWGLTELTGFDGTVKKVTTVNLKSKAVLEYNYKLFSYWMDPDHDGKFDDGVDGFRLDHMMDELDHKEKFKGLFKDFWVPLLNRLHALNPKLIITAEQADWGSYGFEYLKDGDVDRVFAFPLLLAMASFNKDKIARVADSTFFLTPEGKQQVVFIENHDVQRFATTAASDPGKLRAAAAMNLLIGGIPSVYYGQEIGMKGAGGFNKFGNTDANDIPQREAFEWYKKVEWPGMALWYKGTGPWWDQTNLKADDGISYEEQKLDPNSLWNYYRNLLILRKKNPLLITGKYQTVKNNNEKVLSFLRYENQRAMLVIINLSGDSQVLSIDVASEKIKFDESKMKRVMGEAGTSGHAGQIFTTGPFETQVWALQ